MNKITVNRQREPIIHIGSKELQLSDYISRAVKSSGQSVYVLERATGLVHPTISFITSNRNKSLNAMVATLDALGYDFYISKRELKDG